MTDRLNIIVSPPHRTLEMVFSPRDRERLESLGRIIWGRDEPMPREDFAAALPEADAVVFGRWPWGRDALRHAGPRLKALLEVSGGHWHDLDYADALKRGLYVGSCAHAFAEPVAEMGLALTLAASRGLAANDRRFRTGQERWMYAGCADAFMLRGKTIGMVGFGGIARRLVALLKPFNVRILAYDPFLGAEQITAGGAQAAGLETIFEQGDVIYILATPMPDNQGMIGRALMERIQPHRVLVVLSRASLVDFDAMTQLVLAGRFRVGVDVFPREPLPPDHPIRQAEGAVLSGHSAGALSEALHDIGRMVVDDLEAIAQGRPPAAMQPLRPEWIGRVLTR
jgi:phosphoglycerate dehydrogenase-like enzyme